MKTAKHPYVAIRCPYTCQTLMVKEGDRKWIWGGKEYSALDDILVARGKKFNKQVDYGQ